MIDFSSVRDVLRTYKGRATIWNLNKISGVSIESIPYSIRILIENLLRNYDGKIVTEEDVKAILDWRNNIGREIPYLPSRVILQDFTGVPALVDLAAMRDAMKKLGGDPKIVNPLVPVHLIIDHSVQVDYYGTSYALYQNINLEMERNIERYSFLKWAEKAFKNLKVASPGFGIIHQVNLEYLAKVVHLERIREGLVAFPDTVIGTDSHTTMVSSIGVLGWGVGGIEAEAVMLGQPYYISIPEVVGVRLEGEPKEGVNATDIVLTITEILRKKNLVDKIVEFIGPGVEKLSAPDRATISNMSPEYGPRTAYFPIDREVLRYLEITARSREHIRFVERYSKKIGIFRDESSPTPDYVELITIDLGEVEPTIAGPLNPEDRIPLSNVKERFIQILNEYLEDARKRGLSIETSPKALVEFDGVKTELTHGNIVIAAITSCVNTSNPSLMIGAALLAKKAVERGLSTKPWVKTSFAPGSPVVVEYLKKAGLLQYLEALRFHVVGFGCTTCIGNSGPLQQNISNAIKTHQLYVVSILSGNRNFAGRIHPLTRGSFLASPLLVVAYAIAGRIDIDLLNEPIGRDPNNNPVFLRDIWPSSEEVKEVVKNVIKPSDFRKKYSKIFEGGPKWREISIEKSDLYPWDEKSTYIRRPPFFDDITLDPPPLKDIKNARVLVMLGDRITTDHISPAGSIPVDSLAGKYLIERGVKPEDFNTYGSRRGNHEVMIRGTFDNLRLRNLLTPEKEGGWTIHHPSGELLRIYDASQLYMKEGVSAIVLAGKQYGAGSSRDWAAKGPYLLGVKAVLAESFESIHRSNLVGMGILPLQFEEGKNWKTLGLTGREVYDIEGIEEGLYPRKKLRVIARREDGSEIVFNVIARLDTNIEVEYFKHGGILKYVLRKLYKESKKK
ncbi:MAG: aconitate hydratase AcnA [Aigarchaeota archaeon]|nr:aconitate hydratase AcnA [Aigarchaeota archaeon]MCX8192816.1 aconitate hydratase AcnA [Nitrososphaeria archaeon]MDW7986060.1 aconitate hydratase AcnA [Nitrososphaerota archaeon]